MDPDAGELAVNPRGALALLALSVILPCLLVAYVAAFLVGSIGTLHPTATLALGAAFYASLQWLWRVAAFSWRPQAFLIYLLMRAANAALYLKLEHHDFTSIASRAFFSEQRAQIRKMARKPRGK